MDSVRWFQEFLLRTSDRLSKSLTVEASRSSQTEEAAAVLPQSLCVVMLFLFGDVLLSSFQPALSVSSFFLRPAGDRAEEEDR